MEVIYFVVVIVFIIIQFFIAAEMEEIAKIKGCEYSKRYFWFSFLLGLPGWIMVAALPNKNLEDQLNTLISAGTKNVAVRYTAPTTPLSATDSSAQAATTPAAPYYKPIIAEDGKIECPRCRFVQNADRNVCWSCGAKFQS